MGIAGWCFLKEGAALPQNRSFSSKRKAPLEARPTYIQDTFNN
jgi:hypothetical protein